MWPSLQVDVTWGSPVWSPAASWQHVTLSEATVMWLDLWKIMCWLRGDHCIWSLCLNLFTFGFTWLIFSWRWVRIREGLCSNLSWTYQVTRNSSKIVMWRLWQSVMWPRYRSTWPVWGFRPWKDECGTCQFIENVMWLWFFRGIYFEIQFRHRSAVNLWAEVQVDVRVFVSIFFMWCSLQGVFNLISTHQCWGRDTSSLRTYF